MACAPPAPPQPPRGLCACRRRFCFLKKWRPWKCWTHILSILSMFIDLRASWYFFQKVGNQIKWLCQLDAHRNSLQKDVPYRPRCSSKVWFLKQFLDFANLGLNVNLKNRGWSWGSPSQLQRGARHRPSTFKGYTDCSLSLQGAYRDPIGARHRPSLRCLYKYIYIYI